MKHSVVLRIDHSSPTPAYRQIVDGLRLLFVSGQVKPGDTLPTVRDLAMELGIHFSTVAEAYRTLSGEGWLELKRRHGAIVTERHNPSPAPEARADFGKNLRQLIAQVRAQGLSVRAVCKELEIALQELTA